MTQPAHAQTQHAQAQPQSAQGDPRTALALLLGTESGAPEAFVQRILAAGAAGNLGRALEALPEVTREVAVREVAAATAGLLNLNLIDMLVAGWRDYEDLTAAARRTLAVPGSIELVQLATHRITASQQPYVSVLVDGCRVATLQLGLSVVFDISVLLAGIKAGRLVALHSGHADITATLAVEGVEVVSKQGHLELPGVIQLGVGIRMLPLRDYPSAKEPAEGAAQMA
jgi:hypothetical protein